MSLFTPELGLMIWMLISLLLTVFVLGKFGWPVILRSVQKRANFIENGVLKAKEAIEQLEAVKVEAKILIDKAKAQQDEMLKETAKFKDELISDAKEKAQLEAKKILDEAMLSIQQSKEEALKELRNEVVKLSLEISTKVLRQNLIDEASQKQMIEKMIDELKFNN